MIYIYTLAEHFDPLKNKNRCSTPPPPPQIEYSFFGSFQGLARLSSLKGIMMMMMMMVMMMMMMMMKLVVKHRSVGVEVDRSFRITRKGFFRTNSFISYHT